MSTYRVLIDWIDHTGQSHVTELPSTFPSADEAEQRIRQDTAYGVVCFVSPPDPPDGVPVRFYVPIHRVICWTLWENKSE